MQKYIDGFLTALWATIVAAVQSKTIELPLSPFRFLNSDSQTQCIVMVYVLLTCYVLFKIVLLMALQAFFEAVALTWEWFRANGVDRADKGNSAGQGLSRQGGNKKTVQLTGNSIQATS
jgi:hypothetical protein